MFGSAHDPIYVSLIDEFICAREAQGLTVRELGAKLKVPNSFVTKVEKRVRKLSVVEFVQYSLALGLDPTILTAKMSTELANREASGS
jgi:transcriptional regulator with XRE-family HTH domain